MVPWPETCPFCVGLNPNWKVQDRPGKTTLLIGGRLQNPPQVGQNGGLGATAPVSVSELPPVFVIVTVPYVMLPTPVLNLSGMGLAVTSAAAGARIDEGAACENEKPDRSARR